MHSPAPLQESVPEAICSIPPGMPHAISAAKASGCDAYLTGDVKYHDFFQSENQILICDIGHFESEQFVTEQIVEILSEKFPTFAFLKSTEKTNPVNYFF